MIVPTAEGSGTIVPSVPVLSSKDEMMTGGLHVIGGIDVVAILVPAEGAWQIEATEACTAETQLQDRGRPTTREQVKGERSNSDEVRNGRDTAVRELEQIKVKMGLTSQRCERHQARKLGQDGHAERSKQPSITMSVVSHGSHDE